MGRLGVITGLQSEARLLESVFSSERAMVCCPGPGPARAYAAARALIEDRARVLASIGIAAGLDPALEPGRLVLADTVIAGEEGTRIAATPALVERILERCRESGIAVYRAGIAGVERPLARPSDKARLLAATGACAADMESHAVARAAAERGLPFFVLRSIADPAGRALPRFTEAALTANGKIRPAGALWALAARPWEIGALVALARDSARAGASLRRVAPLFSRDFVERLLDV